MKIMLSARRFVPPFKGGVDVYAERLGSALRRLGHVVAFMAFDVNTSEGAAVGVSKEHHQGAGVWRLNVVSQEHLQTTFPYAYDPEMGTRVREVLKAEQPDLLIVLNFYLATLASVEAAKTEKIPIAHIATDFVPICRRSTLVRWNEKPCRTGETVKDCAACFVSNRPIGRIGAAVLNTLPEKTLVNMASSGNGGVGSLPARAIRPYLKQISIMKKRIEILQPLREQIDHLYAPTRCTADAFLGGGFHQDQVHLLPFAVDEASPLAAVPTHPSEKTRFLFIGRLQPYKGVHLLVRAFNALSDPRGAELKIYGVQDGHERYFQDLKSAMDANPRVHFMGSIDPSELADAFSVADYFILPSIWHENSPLILLDALQSRTPVIASDIGGVADLIKDGRNGFLFPMGDADALRDVLQKVISQPSLKDQLQPDIDLPYIDDYAETILAHFFGPASGSPEVQASQR